MADHNDHNLLTACHASSFLPLEIGILSDHGRSDVASCNLDNLLDVHYIPGNLGPRAISSLHSNSKRRNGNANAIPDCVILLLGASGPSHANACICSVAFTT
jgi:hypothetical protein